MAKNASRIVDIKDLSLSKLVEVTDTGFISKAVNYFKLTHLEGKIYYSSSSNIYLAVYKHNHAILFDKESLNDMDGDQYHRIYQFYTNQNIESRYIRPHWYILHTNKNYGDKLPDYLKALLTEEGAYKVDNLYNWPIYNMSIPVYMDNNQIGMYIANLSGFFGDGNVKETDRLPVLKLIDYFDVAQSLDIIIYMPYTKHIHLNGNNTSIKFME